MSSKDLHNIFEKVQKPARYVGGEINVVRKDPGKVKTRLALVFPDLYEVGMSHLGLKILYGLANRQEEVYAERFFAPAGDLEEILRREGICLFSLESYTPLKNFDLVGFTLQYELSYTTILKMLSLGGVPLRTVQRKEGDPFVLGGGPLALNPEPLAPFFDFFVLGDGEEVLPEILNEFARWKKRDGVKREAFLQEIAGIPGIYVPSFYEPLYDGDKFAGIKRLRAEAPLPVKKGVVRDLENTFYPDSFIVPYMDVVHDRAILELFRGCSQGCRFCQAGYIYRPVRERSVAKLKSLAGEIIKQTGWEEISLSSLSSSDYSRIEELVEELQQEFAGRHVRLSLPSLRADPFSLYLADKVQENRAGGVTFAPEAGSQRLRNVINKRITEEEILAAAEQAFISGRSHIKLYFMLGLPTETEEDLRELVKLIEKILTLRQTVKRKRYPLKVIVSASTFVPKAHTPFQWEPQLEMAEVKCRQQFLREHLRKLKGVQFTWPAAEMSFLEAVFSRGDRRLAAVLERACALGSRLEAWSERFDFALWEEAFYRENIDPRLYAYYKPAVDDPLPWEHLASGVSKKFLQEEYRKAFQGETTCDCRQGGCQGCGLEDCPARQVSKNVPI
ncbi:MAG: TIGR03960 family B12-binding radical SAM protein [Dethiobacteria bacterium]